MWRGVLIRLPSSPRCSKAGPQAPAGVQICPPERERAKPGWRQRLLDWLAGGWPARDDAEQPDQPEFPVPGTHATPLDAVRLEFILALDDIATGQAGNLTLRIRRARSLRDLWHLRTELFNVIACQGGQNVATERLQRLNRHFPARAPRSAFGALDVSARLRQ